MNGKSRVLFLCTGNSCRSQMAEGFLRALGGAAYEALSAGTEPKGLNLDAVRAMREAGIDISGQRSKGLEVFLGRDLDWVITVCDLANESCPVFPGSVRRLHWSFQDPALATGTDEERRTVFRRVRDEIGVRVRGFVAERAGFPAG